MSEAEPIPPTSSVTALRIPMIKKGEYDLWSMKMRQYIAITDHILWDIITNGDQATTDPASSSLFMVHKAIYAAQPMHSEERTADKEVSLSSEEQALHDELVNLMHQESLAKLHHDAQRTAFEEEKKRIALAKEKACANSTFTLSTAKTPPQSTGNTPTDSDDDVPKDGVFSTNSFDAEHTDTEEDGAPDYNNMNHTIDVSSTPTLRIHKIHPQSQIIGKSTAGVQTRRKLKESTSNQHQALLSFIYKQNRTNHKDQQTCLFACFLSQEEPKKVSQALADESWVEAMQEELLQFKLQDVWVLCDLPDGKRVIGTKWVFRNKRDERGTIMIEDQLQEDVNILERSCSLLRIAKKRKILAISSTEQEYVAAASCCAQKQKKKVSSVKLGRNKEEGTLSEEHYVQDDYTADPFFEDIVDKDAAVTPDLERKSDETEEINIEEKKASDVKSGDTEELDLEAVQSTARQSTITPRTLNFNDEAGPSSPIRPTQNIEPEEQFKVDEVLADISRPRGLSIPGPIQSQPQPQQPSQATDPKDKGKGILVEEPKKKKLTLQQIRALETTNDEEVARKIQAEWDAEEERKRFEELKKAKPKTTLRKPTSLAQERNQMMNFLKGQGYKNLQKLKYPQMKELYDKVQESIKDSFKDFIPMDSEKEREMLKEREAKRLLRKRKATISEEQPSKKVKLRTETVDELRNYLRIVDFEKNAQDRESLEGISMITELQVIDSPDGEYLIIHRANNHFRAFDTLWEILHILDRQDLYHLYRVVQDYYEHIPPTGLGLILLGDLTTIWETAEISDDDFWKNQEDWEIVRWRLNESSGVHTLELEDGTMIHMLAERRYPLSRELMIRMLEHGMEVEDESEIAITLIHLFILWTTKDGDDS
ncbi:hypothetical protein Tco_0204608 [Tanacetum coccineum]